MPDIPKINRDDIHFKSVKFFVCACSHCGEKHEIFANEIHRPHQCRKCGGNFHYDECAFDVLPEK